MDCGKCLLMEWRGEVLTDARYSVFGCAYGIWVSCMMHPYKWALDLGTHSPSRSPGRFLTGFANGFIFRIILKIVCTRKGRYYGRHLNMEDHLNSASGRQRTFPILRHPTRYNLAGMHWILIFTKRLTEKDAGTEERTFEFEEKTPVDLLSERIAAALRMCASCRTLFLNDMLRMEGGE